MLKLTKRWKASQYPVIYDSDCGENLPFAERVARKLSGSGISINNLNKNKKKTGASAFSDSDDSDSEEVVKAPLAKVSKNDTLEITPPPICSPASPVRTSYNIVPDNDNLDDIGGLTDLLPKVHKNGTGTEKGKKTNSVKTGSSVGISKKEMEKRKREEKKIDKENQKQKSKAMKDAEKLVAKQTEKSEVNKYLQVVMDPALVSSPPGSDILHLLQQKARTRVSIPRVIFARGGVTHVAEENHFH